jgi:putative addiction module antidote
MERRIFKTGNSIGLSIPREILDGLGLVNGDKVSLEFDHQHRRVIITPFEQSLANVGVDEEYARQVNQFIDHYRPALEELAK